MALFDWFGRMRGGASEGVLTWDVQRDGDELVATDSRGKSFRVWLPGARSVRVVAMSSGGDHHSAASGWQVALSRGEGDVLLGPPQVDWRSAHELARQTCRVAELPMDELTEKLFSRVGKIVG